MIVNRYTGPEVTARYERIYPNQSMPKTMRGFGKFYDAVLEHYADVDVLTELGIGNFTCQLSWATAMPNTKIVGIDIASPSIKDCDTDNLDIRQYTNCIAGFELQNIVPMWAKTNIDLHYRRNAYSKETVDEFVTTYGAPKLVINDALQRPYAVMPFQEHWYDALDDTGVLIQERFGRNPPDGIYAPILTKSINKGWLIYDCREFVKFENPDVNGFIGIRPKNPADTDMWIEKLSHFRRITDPVDQIEEQFLTHSLE